MALALFLFTSACAVSPEAARTRGGGPGADVGNHGAPVQIHGTTNPGFGLGNGLAPGFTTPGLSPYNNPNFGNPLLNNTIANNPAFNPAPAFNNRRVEVVSDALVQLLYMLRRG